MYYKHTLLTALLLTSTLGYADKDKKKDKGKDASAPTAEKKSEKKTIKEAIKGTKEIKGLFTIYQDTTTGNTLLKVSKEQIGKAYIYFSYCENGSIATGQIKGGFRGSSIFTYGCR